MTVTLTKNVDRYSNTAAQSLDAEVVERNLCPSKTERRSLLWEVVKIIAGEENDDDCVDVLKDALKPHVLRKLWARVSGEPRNVQLTWLCPLLEELFQPG